MISILFALALSQSPSIIDVERAALSVRDAGVVDVVGGAWLSDEKLIEYAQKQKTLRAENEALKSSATPIVIVLSVCAAFIGGTITGFVITNKLK